MLRIVYATSSGTITMHRLRWPESLAAIGINAMRSQPSAHSCYMNIETRSRSSRIKIARSKADIQCCKPSVGNVVTNSWAEASVTDQEQSSTALRNQLAGRPFPPNPDGRNMPGSPPTERPLPRSVHATSKEWVSDRCGKLPCLALIIQFDENEI